MNIGMVLDNDFQNDKRVENEIIILQNSGFNVFLLCATYGNKEIISDFNGAKVIKTPWNKKLMRSLRALTNTIFDFYPGIWAKHIVKFVEDYQIDVLHIHELYMLGSGFIANKKLKKRIPIVGDLHENYADGLAGYKFSTSFLGKLLISIEKWRETEKLWVSSLDYAITVIKEMKDRVSPYLDPEKIYIYQNVVNIDKFLKYDDLPELYQKYADHFVISYIGGLDIHRGVGTIIDALPELKDKIRNLKMIIVGRGNILSELKEKCSELGVESIVDFVGWQSQKHLPNYFKISDVGVIPHLRSVQTDNSSPNKLYQYMLMEKPVISTDCKSLKRMILETDSGLVYKSGDSIEFTKQLLKLYSNKDLAQKFGKNGKEAVLSKYNSKEVGKNLVNLYETIKVTEFCGK